MDAELPFRILLPLFFVIPMSYWLANVAIAWRSMPSGFSRREPAVVGVLFRLLQATSTLLIALYAIKPELVAFGRVALPVPVRLVGILLDLLGSLSLCWTLRSLGRNFSPTLELSREHRVVRNGPYRFVLHPMYDSFMLLWAGYLLISANWAIGASGLAAQLLIAVFRTPSEEAMLAERFGREYVEYAGQTGRFLPRRSALFPSRRSPGGNSRGTK